MDLSVRDFTQGLPRDGALPTPAPGQVWTVTVNGENKGAVLIASVRGIVVTAWPVTPLRAAVAPAFIVRLESFNSEALVVWPEAEFGLTRAALGCSLGAPLTAEQVEGVARAAAAGIDLPSGVEMCSIVETEEALDALDQACLYAWDLGAWVWPSAEQGAGVLDEEILSASGVDAERLGRDLSLRCGTARRMFEGNLVPTLDQLRILVDQGVDVDSVLRPPSGSEAEALTDPRHKAKVTKLAAVRNVDESTVRSMIWGQVVGKAARQTVGRDPIREAHEKIDAALQKLLEPCD
jgi:hypothetical protein